MRGVVAGLAILLSLGALGVAAAPASAATHECDGLTVCVPVAGPWVVVPTGRRAPLPHVEYQLSCPRGYVVGGLDAELSDRAIDIGFAAKLGSPVNPGITTSRAAVFTATYVGASAVAPSFRPHIGCMPATGGGRRIPTAAVVAPGQPTVRHVRTVRLRTGHTQGIAQGCASGERLVGGSHAVGFFGQRPPSATVAHSVTATQSFALDHVTVVARAGAAALGAHAAVQVSAICAGGR